MNTASSLRRGFAGAMQVEAGGPEGSDAGHRLLAVHNQFTQCDNETVDETRSHHLEAM